MTPRLYCSRQKDMARNMPQNIKGEDSPPKAAGEEPAAIAAGLAAARSRV
nr:MAG TPA: hypothetical protein [Bacteriophage sp.]